MKRPLMLLVLTAGTLYAQEAEPAKFLVFFVKDKGTPVLVPAK